MNNPASVLNLARTMVSDVTARVGSIPLRVSMRSWMDRNRHGTDRQQIAPPVSGELWSGDVRPVVRLLARAVAMPTTARSLRTPSRPRRSPRRGLARAAVPRDE